MYDVPMHIIAEILGHKTLSMVQRYVQFNVEHLKEAVSDMNRKKIS